MATITWTGGANNGNWSTAENWTGGVPLGNDDVFILVSAQDIITLPANIPASGSLTSLTVGPGFKGSIGGGVAGSANIAATTVNLSMGGAAVYLGTGTRTTTNIDSTGFGGVFITAGTNTTINVGIGANVDIGGTATYTTLNSAGRVTDAAGTAGTTCDIGAGLYRTFRSVANLRVGATAIVQYITSAAVTASARVEGGGRLNWQSAGNLVGMTLMPRAVFDVEGCLQSFAISGTLTQWAGSAYNIAVLGITVTDSGASKVFIGKRS